MIDKAPPTSAQAARHMQKYGNGARIRIFVWLSFSHGAHQSHMTRFCTCCLIKFTRQTQSPLLVIYKSGFITHYCNLQGNLPLGANGACQSAPSENIYKHVQQQVVWRWNPKCQVQFLKCKHHHLLSSLDSSPQLGRHDSREP